MTSLKNAVFARREMPEFILPLLWPPNLPDLNPLDKFGEYCNARCTLLGSGRGMKSVPIYNCPWDK